MPGNLFRAVGLCVSTVFLGGAAVSATMDLPLLGFSAAASGTETTGTTGGSLPISRSGPSIGLTPLIQTDAGDGQHGQVRWFGGTFAPRGFEKAEGQLVSIASYPDLFAKLGTTYGGDGTTTFALPDLRGRAVVGASDTLRLGTQLGTNSVTLTEANLPAHTHSVDAEVSAGGRTESTGGGVSFTNRQPSLALTYETDTSSGVVTLDAATGTGGASSAVPELAERLPIGAGNGPGLTAFRDGDLVGSDRTTLTEDTMPAHSHPVAGEADTGSTGGSEQIETREPSMALRFIVAMAGVYPSLSTSPETMVNASLSADPMLGEIALFTGNFAPRGWAFADGQLLPISSNDGLFSLFGTIYGGDGRTTFSLPDLRGRTPVGAGRGPGLQSVFLGQKFGSENFTLNVANLPAHAHALIAPVPLPLPGLVLIAGLGGLGLVRARRRTA